MDVRPTPTDEEAAAIAAALVVAMQGGSAPLEAPVTPRWRFAGRWWTKPIPVRRDRPW